MPGCQPTLLDEELKRKASLTRRGAFLAELEEAVPWGRLERLVAPLYFEGRAGRAGSPAVPLPVMLRMYLASVVYNLSDRACQDERDDSASVRSFVGLGERDAPDETALCKFRHLLEDNGLGARVLEEADAALAEHGVGRLARHDRGRDLRRGARLDQEQGGGPGPGGPPGQEGEQLALRLQGAHRRGRGAPAGAPGRRGGVGGLGLHGRCEEGEVASDRAPSRVAWHVAAKRSKVAEADRPFEKALPGVRSRVEHPFHVVKDLFGIRKVRCRGLAKAAHLMAVAFALANLLLARRAPRRCVAPHGALRAGA